MSKVVTFLSVFTLLFVVTACGDSESSNSVMQSLWNDYCAAGASGQSSATGCPADAPNPNDMVSFCQAFSSVLIESSACEEKLNQLIACIPTRTYECSGSSSVAFPVQPDPCAQLEAAFVVSNEPSQAGECIDTSKVSSN